MRKTCVYLSLAFVSSFLLITTNALAYSGGVSIGINFGADEPNGENTGGLNPSDVAGVPAVATANWNNTTGLTGTLDNLNEDVVGTLQSTTASVTWNANGTWASTGSRGEENNNFPDPSTDRTLFTGYLDTGNATTTTIDVSGLGAEFAGGYDVYVYMLGGAGGRGGTYTVSNSVVTIEKQGTGGPSGGAQSGPDYVEDPGVDGTDTGNYLVFHNVMGTSFTLFASTEINPFGGTPRAPVDAIEIVATAASARYTSDSFQHFSSQWGAQLSGEFKFHFHRHHSQSEQHCGERSSPHVERHGREQQPECDR